MVQQAKKLNPGDAANAFVRVILSDAGAMLGGLTETEWVQTLDWFGGRCAYTDEALVDGRTDRDHAVPMNRTHCGLHLYGNVLPTTREANQQKAGKHYRDFVEDPDRLKRIESFVKESGYLGPRFGLRRPSALLRSPVPLDRCALPREPEVPPQSFAQRPGRRNSN